MKKGDVFESSSGYQLMRLKVLLKHEGYESEYEYSGFLPRLVITKVTWKARLRKLKRWTPFTIADGRN
jgi:hypothetical protein